ncbi:MAG: carboxy-S-adenosyl-L-methionine synthase CmoA [Thermodesulfobacteriota bacterium]
MKRDRVYRGQKGITADFEFNDTVADVFDDMVSRSVPYYSEQQRMIREIGSIFSTPGSNIYDLGCATATTLINLCPEVDPSVSLIGYDNSPPMIKKAKQKIKESGFEDRIRVLYADLNGDLDQIELSNASVVLICWTLQFVRPLKREKLINKIYQGLNENGVLIITEKILTNSSLLNRYYIKLYYDYKQRNEYTNEEIENKREALENILIPYRIDENIEMFKRNGFETVDTFFQWYNFVGFICIKSRNPAHEIHL